MYDPDIDSRGQISPGIKRRHREVKSQSSPLSAGFHSPPTLPPTNQTVLGT